MYYIGLAVVIALITFAFTRRLWISGVVLGIEIVLAYVALPTLAWGFEDAMLMLLVAAVVVFVAEFWLQERKSDYRHEVDNSGLRAGFIFFAVTICCLIFVPLVTTWSAFNRADQYRAIIGNVKEGEFSSDTSPIDITQVRRVDQKLAKRLAEKYLGSDLGLGSQVEVGAMSIQSVNGTLWWVGPLNHRSVFKWLSFSGTPGYVKVSAVDERQIELVQQVGGKPVNLKYNMGSALWDYPARYLYERGYATVGFADWTFEINDEGRPYWVVTRFEKRIGFSGSDATGVILLDPQTGDIKEYPIADAPAWIDRIQPEAFVAAHLDWWGAFGKGWWNSWLAQEEVIRTTEGMSLVYGKDGRSYWYTGMQSAGAEKGTVGFVLVDTRTKAAKIYRQAGAAEDAAMASAQGAVQEKGYGATFPILYNVSGQPTYFLTLKDDAGLVKLLAFVSVENYSIVGIGPTVRDALRSYRRLMLTEGNVVASDTSVERQTVTGKVLRIKPETAAGGVTYYLYLQGSETKLFAGGSGLSPELVITEPGDLVRVEFDDGGNSVVDIASFDNLEITLQKTQAQETLEKRAAAETK